MLKNVFILILSVSFLGACTNTIRTHSLNQDRVSLELERPSPLNLQTNIKWIYSEDKNEHPLVCLTPTDYEKMSMNLLKIKNYTSEQNQVINSYKSYYEKANKETK